MGTTTDAAQPADHDAAANPDRIVVGRVVSTTGSQISAVLRRDIGDQEGVQVGSLVSIRGPLTTIYGIVNGLTTRMPDAPGGAEVHMAEIGLIGEVTDRAIGGNGQFRRGVSKLPSLNTPVYSVSYEETSVVYAFPGKATVSIGSVFHNPNVLARVGIDDLLSKHFALLGTTGSGKSCGMVVVLKQLIAQHSFAHVLVLDPHGEYGAAFGEQAERLSIDNFRLPYWIFNFDEFTEVLFGPQKPDMSAEILCLRDIMVAAKVRSAPRGIDIRTVTVDTPIPYIFSDLIALLDGAMGRLDSNRNVPTYLRLKEMLTRLRTDRRYEFMFSQGITVHDDFAEMLGRMFRVPANGKPIAVFDLGGIASEVLNVVVGVVSRLAFDFAFWSRQKIPILLVCDEAHRFATQSTSHEFALAKRALTQIANEGRKYGISLAVASQRPSELASNILSQCNTVFAFRTSNERDQEVLRAALSDAAGAIVAALPFLGNTEAIVVGEGVPVPMRLRFIELAEDERPRSSSAKFSERWNDGSSATRNELEHLVTIFRSHTDDGSAPPPPQPNPVTATATPRWTQTPGRFT